MSNQEIHIHTNTDVNGIVHLDIPVGIANHDIDVTVSYSIEETKTETPNIDHLLGAFNSRESQKYTPVEKSDFGKAIIEKLAEQGIALLL
ncbi:MAG: hypothetical protein AAF298_07390 [Cyanobacteria bacterium P01_A01_bin.40]